MEGHGAADKPSRSFFAPMPPERRNELPHFLPSGYIPLMTKRGHGEPESASTRSGRTCASAPNTVAEIE